MNLTFEAVRKIVDIGSKITELRQKIDCQFIVQIVENYFPSSQKDKVDHCVCFLISDGHAKMKGLFLKTLNPYLVQLQEKDPIQYYPLIQIKLFRILGRPVAGEDFPILIIEFELVMKDAEKVIGTPISYKSYAMNGFKNPNGATSLEEQEFAGIEELIFSEEKQLPLNNFPKQQQIVQGRQDEKQKIKISIGKSKIVKQQPDVCQEQVANVQNSNNPFKPKSNDDSINQMKSRQQAQPIFTKQFTNQNQQQQQLPQKKNQLKVLVAQNQEYTHHQKQENNIDFFPLYQINPSFQQPFRGRVVRINELKSYQKNQREGKMFGMTIMDEEHTVYLLFFDQVADKFYEYLEQGKCYIFQGITVKPPKNIDSLQKMNCLPFDFSVDMNSQIIEIDDVPKIPINSFNFVKLNQIQQFETGQIVDVICVIKSSSGVIGFQAKHSEEKSQRISLTVYDDSLYETEITLYGQLAGKYTFANQDIYMFKSLKIGEYQNRRNLMSNYQTTVHFDQNQKEVKVLKQWLNNFDGKLVQQVSKVKLISQILQEASKCELDQNLKIYSEVRAKLVMIKNSGNLFYESCTNCLKKVMKEFDQYFCSSCNIHFDEPRLRYFLSAKIADQSGNIWISVGEEYANLILDCPANLMKIYLNEGKEKEKNDALSKFIFKEYRFKLISKLEEFNQIKRIKHSASMITPISNADTWQILNEVEFYMKNI